MMAKDDVRADHRRILSVDCGSSSLKIAVYELGAAGENMLVEGGIERLGAPDVSLHIRDYRGSTPHDVVRPLGSKTAVAALLALLHEFGLLIDGVGHRLVYGGSEHEQPARVTTDLMTSLALLVPFDPLHLPAALAAIREIATASPDLPQVACFDTAFHRRMPMVAQRFALPRELWSEGVRRYGFHGLSYESIVRTLGERRTHGAMIVAHLGSGASLAAMRDGKPVDTTMGLTPLGGLMMGTRPGDLDPGVLLYLLRTGRYTLEQLEDMLTERSGLLGVSQISADMRTLLERRAADAAAAQAIELFVYQAKKYIGALVAVLGDLNTLVFTGGMGESSAVIRAEITEGLTHLGIELDPIRNAAGAASISTDKARVVVRVIKTNETLMVARHAFATLFEAGDARDEASTPVLKWESHHDGPCALSLAARPQARACDLGRR
jgi:acetate kinase